MQRLLSILLVGVVLAAGCGSDTSGELPAGRPPLASPPDPGPPPDNDGLTADVRHDVAKSTVRVTGIACGRTTEGSGFAVGSDLIATNAHVLVGLDTPTAELGDARPASMHAEARGNRSPSTRGDASWIVRSKMRSAAAWPGAAMHRSNISVFASSSASSSPRPCWTRAAQVSTAAFDGGPVVPKACASSSRCPHQRQRSSKSR